MTEVRDNQASSELNNKEKPQPGSIAIETEAVWRQMDEKEAE